MTSDRHAAAATTLDEPLDAVARVLRTASSALVCGHVDPDGDALGSVLALTTVLRDLGVDAQPAWGSRDPGAPPAPLDPALAFLPSADLVRHPDDVHPAPDVVVACDTAAPTRLGTLQSALGRSGTVVVIDHHDLGEPFGDLRLVDPGASSTGALVLQLLDRLGAPLTPPVADALYLAVLTDTGRFSYSSTTPADHRIAARLLEAGADHVRVAQAVYESASPGFLDLVARVAARAVVGEALIWSHTTRDDLAATGATEEDVEGLIDLLRRVGGDAVVLFMRQTPTGRLRCSLRSRGPDVATIAGSFGGGGHHLAAGFTADGDPRAVADAVRAALDAKDVTP